MLLDDAAQPIQNGGMSVTLEIDEKTLASLPLGPGEQERHMQIELACRFYARGWLSLGQAARMAGLDQYAFGVALAERGIPRQYGLTEAQEDLDRGKVAHSEELGKEFERLAKQWKEETSLHSSLGEIFTNDAYQRIMAMGHEALPLILSDLQKTPAHWFYALEKIVGRDMAGGADTFDDARAAWLEWGHKSNYIE
jgi:predicted HTH domain antitoxin